MSSELEIAGVGALSVVGVKLIEKVSQGVAGLFEPIQKVRMAKAERDAAMIRVTSDVEITDYQRTAIRRWANEEGTRQWNMEQIASGAIPHLDIDAKPESIENDWITNFFDKCRIVSDADMQQLWSKVLAGEANSPNSFSRKTVNLLADMDSRDAQNFESLLRFCCDVNGTLTPMVLGYWSKIFNEGGFTGGAMLDLDSLGLIIDSTKDLTMSVTKHDVTIDYFGRTILLKIKQDKRPSIPFGRVRFTRAGRELARTITASAVDGFLDYLETRLKPHCASLEIRDT